MLFNINFSIFGFSDVITSVRISLLLTLFVFILYFLGNNGKVKLGVLNNEIVILGLVSVFIVAFSLTISFLLNMKISNFNYVLTAWFQFFLYLIFSIILPFKKEKELLSSLVGVILLYVLILGVFLIFGIEGQGLYQIRGELNQVFPQGLNRFLNGFVFLWVIPIAVFHNFLPRSLVNLIASFMIFLIGAMLLIYSGSRQYFLSVVILFFVAGLIDKKKGVYVIVSLLFLVAALIILLGPELEEIKLQLYRRFVEVTVEQATLGSDRFDRYDFMFSLLSNQPLWGVGPGGFFNITGLYPDSGILQYLTENGVLSFFVHIGIVLLLILIFFFKRNSYSGISKIIFSFFIINFFIQNFFNELFLEYYTWLILPLAIYLKNYRYKAR